MIPAARSTAAIPKPRRIWPIVIVALAALAAAATVAYVRYGGVP